jgi:hypothetical protein
MDKKSEQLARQKILWRFSKHLQRLGFSRSKSSFFIRPAQHLIEFIHVHKYSFDSDFRVHLGLRVLTDPFEAVALNGPDSHEAVCRKKYDFHFDESGESVEECAESLFRFCAEDGEEWFKSWRKLERLLQDQGSPLGAEAKKALASALSGSCVRNMLQGVVRYYPPANKRLQRNSP